jgi:hypothetical protein
VPAIDHIYEHHDDHICPRGDEVIFLYRLLRTDEIKRATEYVHHTTSKDANVARV